MKEWSSVEDVLMFWRENYDEDMEMKNVLFRRILMSKDLIFNKVGSRFSMVLNYFVVFFPLIFVQYFFLKAVIFFTKV